jgi:transcriptional antiterminator NusG
MEAQDPEEKFKQEPVEEESAEEQQPAAPAQDAPLSDLEPESGPELPIPSPAADSQDVSSPDTGSEQEPELPIPSPIADSQDISLPDSEPETEPEPEPEIPAPAPVAPTKRAARSASKPKPEPESVSEIPVPVEGLAWFVIHCYSGYENKVRHNLEQRIETMGMKDKIFDVVIPTQEEIEVKDGKRRTVERHIFPGYVLVNMVLSEESWYVVRNTPGVTGFVGMGTQPTPLRPEEVAQIVKRMEAEAPTVKVTYKVGERVRIVDGPFNDFRGVVAEIDMERTKVRVMVSFFGRETPVELDFLQVEKA